MFEATGEPLVNGKMPHARKSKALTCHHDLMQPDDTKQQHISAMWTQALLGGIHPNAPTMHEQFRRVCRQCCHRHVIK